MVNSISIYSVVFGNTSSATITIQTIMIFLQQKKDANVRIFHVSYLASLKEKGSLVQREKDREREAIVRTGD